MPKCILLHFFGENNQNPCILVCRKIIEFTNYGIYVKINPDVLTKVPLSCQIAVGPAGTG